MVEGTVCITIGAYLELVEREHELIATKKELQMWKDAHAHGNEAAWAFVKETGLMAAYDEWCKKNDAVPF